MDKIVHIPKYLQELHGKESRQSDLWLTYLGAILGTLTILYLAHSLSMPFYRWIVLGLLSFDIAGGVIANFTEGTQRYYAERQKLRNKFIALHLIHPSLLLWVFPSDFLYIICLSLYTLLAMILLNNISKPDSQKVLASFLTLVGLALSFVLYTELRPLQFLLILFMLKLILAFSVQWNVSTSLQDGMNTHKDT